VDGIALWPLCGDKGFGYDPMFAPAGSTLTFGEIERELKHAVSHRARAIEQRLRELLRKARALRLCVDHPSRK